MTNERNNVWRDRMLTLLLGMVAGGGGGTAITSLAPRPASPEAVAALTRSEDNFKIINALQQQLSERLARVEERTAFMADRLERLVTAYTADNPPARPLRKAQ